MTPLDMIYAAILLSAKQECAINYQYSAIVNAAVYLKETDYGKLANVKQELRKYCGRSKFDKQPKGHR